MFSLASGVVGGYPFRSREQGMEGRVGHPDPRPGVSGACVLRPAQLVNRRARAEFEIAARIPHIVDGLRCNCHCSDLRGLYSLLSCFETEGMAQYCRICRDEVRLAYVLFSGGASLREIRAAIDAESW